MKFGFPSLDARCWDWATTGAIEAVPEVTFDLDGEHRTSDRTTRPWTVFLTGWESVEAGVAIEPLLEERLGLADGLARGGTGLLV